MISYWLVLAVQLNNTGFIHSFYFYSASSSPLLLRGAPDTARIPCRSFTPKHNRQLRVKDLPKDPTWRLERDSNPPPFGRMATNQPMSHSSPHAQVVMERPISHHPGHTLQANISSTQEMSDHCHHL